MGIRINFTAKLDEPSTLDPLLHLLHFYAAGMKWKSCDVEEHYSGILLTMTSGNQTPVPPRLLEEHVRGAYLQPEHSETILFTFNSQGERVYYQEVPPEALEIKPAGDGPYYINAVYGPKTWDAQTHIQIINLLRLLKMSFLPQLEVDDDTGFWIHGNVQELEDQHRRMAAFIERLNKDPDFVRQVLRAAGTPIPDDAVITPLDPVITAPPPGKKKVTKAAVN